MSIANGRTRIRNGARDPLVVVPGSLEEARRLFSRLPPPPPGRNIVPMSATQKVRQCHGCHGPIDEDHASVPLGVDKCPLDHDDRCLGGIVGGKGKNGKEWRPCPVNYVDATEREDTDNYSEEDVSSDELEPKENSQLDLLQTNINVPTTDSTAVTSSTTTFSGADNFSVHSSTVTVNSVQQSPRFSTSHGTLEDELSVELAALGKVRKECEALEVQARLRDQQKVSAERMELRRQLEGEKSRLEMLRQSDRCNDTRGAMSQADLIDNMRQLPGVPELSNEFPNFYKGPNIKDIRRTKGLRKNADKVVESVRGDIPSLGHRPSADKPTGTRPKGTAPVKQKSHLGKEYEEFLQFKAWREQTKAGDSDTDDSPPRASKPLKKKSGQRDKTTPTVDPVTDASSSDGESSQPVVLVYRRDENGTKYRSYEPYHDTVVASRDIGVKYTWVTDSITGREYKQAVSLNEASPKVTNINRSGSRHVGKCTPKTSNQHSTGFDHHNRQHQSDRVPGIVSLEDRQGKSDDKKTTTIADWAKNCPVAYAEKIKYEDINLPLWTWACVSEILASRTGLAPSMQSGELDARLQHLLCVLQVALVNSEKTDFNTKGWSIASTYAKRVQQKLDRGLEDWCDFKRFGHDPHPSEMFSAQTEVNKKNPARQLRKREDDKPSYGNRPSYVSDKMCPTWNSCESDRKCQFMVDNPNGAKCNRRHECSYCQEKGLGPNHHQRRLCRKRRDAGDD